MVLTLYTHPLASYWHKGRIALYELPPTGKTVDRANSPMDNPG